MNKFVKQEARLPIGTRVKGYLLSHKGQIALVFLALIICGSMASLQVYAAGSGASDESTIISVISTLGSFVKKIGIGFALFGGVTLGLGFAQDNPDDQSRGVKFLIGGIIIVSVGAYLGQCFRV